MGEIAASDQASVATFVQECFAVTPALAKDYAAIAVFLSVQQQWQPAIEELSALLQEEYWARMCKGHSNRLTGAIAVIGTSTAITDRKSGIDYPVRFDLVSDNAGRVGVDNIVFVS